MAHEYAHIYARHVGKGMNRQYGAMAAAAALAGAGYLAGGEEKGGQYARSARPPAWRAGSSSTWASRARTRTRPTSWASTFYTRAGWDPNKFADFFQQMIDKGMDTTPEMISDHPSLKNRVAETKERVKKLPPTAPGWRRPPVATPERFKQFQARAAELGKTLPSDKTLAGSQELLAALPRSCVSPVVQPDEQKARESLAAKARSGAGEAAGRARGAAAGAGEEEKEEHRRRGVAAAVPAGDLVAEVICGTDVRGCLIRPSSRGMGAPPMHSRRPAARQTLQSR